MITILAFGQLAIALDDECRLVAVGVFASQPIARMEHDRSRDCEAARVRARKRATKPRNASVQFAEAIAEVG